MQILKTDIIQQVKGTEWGCHSGPWPVRDDRRTENDLFIYFTGFSNLRIVHK